MWRANEGHLIAFGKRKRSRVKYTLVSKETKPVTVQRGKAEMLHHEGKVGTHALLTQLLYIIYKSERETKSTEMGTEAIGSSCRSSNHTRSKDHRGKTVIMAAGSLEGSSNLLTGTYSPRTRSFRRAHPSSQSLKKETEGEEKEKAEVSVTVTKTESKAKLK